MDKTNSLLIAGCGYVGMALCRALSAQQWQLYGLRRTPEARADMEAAGARACIADLLQPASLATLPKTGAVVFSAAPGFDRKAYRATYIDGVKNLMQTMATLKGPPSTLLFISSTSVYGDFAGEMVDEQTPPTPASESGKILLQAEQTVLSHHHPALILRLGGIYGPGRDRLRLIKEGQALTASCDYLNQIHIADIVRLIPFLLEHGTPGDTYLGVDDRPLIKTEFYTWLAKRGGLEVPPATPANVRSRSGSKQCSNQKIKTLGFNLLYPDAYAGFSALVPER